MEERDAKLTEELVAMILEVQESNLEEDNAMVFPFTKHELKIYFKRLSLQRGLLDQIKIKIEELCPHFTVSRIAWSLKIKVPSTRVVVPDKLNLTGLLLVHKRLKRVEKRRGQIKAVR